MVAEGWRRPEEGLPRVITPAQCLEARKLLKWSRDRLAPRCELSLDTLRRFETGAKELRPDDLASLQHALEVAGVEFTNGRETGVRLKRWVPDQPPYTPRAG
jgi:transcriptional regulator with XRE-family HTH domain